MIYSLKPSDAVSGGFLNDVDVTIKAARFALWDYAGTQEPKIFLQVSLEDEEGRTSEQYYSAADPDKASIVSEGKSVDGPAGKFNSNCNAIRFLQSLTDVGFPEAQLGGDVSVLDGINIHVNQVAQPKRPGLKDQKDKTILLATKINSLGGEKAKPKPGPKPVPAAAAVTPSPAAPAKTETPAPVAAASDANGDLADKARVLTMDAVSGGALSMTKLSLEVYKKLRTDPHRQPIMQLIGDNSFIKALADEGLVKFDGDTVGPS